MAKSTTERGLGWSHQQARRRLPPPEGEPCPFCGLAMWPDMPLDADHALPRAFGGVDAPLRWSHRRCNRRAGGKLGSQLAKREPGPIRSRRW